LILTLKIDHLDFTHGNFLMGRNYEIEPYDLKQYLCTNVAPII